jgi:hypothetical protein
VLACEPCWNPARQALMCVGMCGVLWCAVVCCGVLRCAVVCCGVLWCAVVRVRGCMCVCAQAAVIAVPHKKWDERPLLIVHLKPDRKEDKESILKFLGERVARWWVPDDIVFVASIPHTATGKILKTELRRLYGNHVMPHVHHARPSK